MPRKPRIWYPGAIYHIVCRGNRRQEIFRDDQDRMAYLGRLLEAKEKHDCKILSYCLMKNHVHLQVQTSDIEIWKMMKQVNMNYAVFFNSKHNCVGHLFQGRYRSKLIETNAYNLAVSRYIHLNPVAAEIAENPQDYEWSSYQVYLGRRSDRIVTVDEILKYFPNNCSIEYQKYVEGALNSGEV